MSKLILGFAAALLGATLVAADAEAGRIGGGRSVGAQRSITGAPPAQIPAKPPKQMQQTGPGQHAAASPGAPAPATGIARWMPMLGGLAAGGLLGWLLGANGLGGLVVGMLLAALLTFGAIALVRALTQRRGPMPESMQYAGLGNETVAAPPPSQAAGFEPLAAAQAEVRSAAPAAAGFDIAAFLRSAKLNFMKLQIANDAGNLEELREFTTPELFEELRRDIEQRSGARQRTDVLSISADLLEIVTEGGKHWASVRFSGTIREAPGAAPAGFEEVWNLCKPVDGSSGWVLAGIQQMH